MYRTRYDIYFERLFLTGNLFPGKVCVMELILDRFKEFPLLTIARKQMKEGGKRPDRANKKKDPLPENRKPPISNKENHREKAQERPKDIFVRAKGFLWKRLPSGRFQEKPYCPSCKLELIAFPPGSDNMLACPKCNFIAI